MPRSARARIGYVAGMTKHMDEQQDTHAAPANPTTPDPAPVEASLPAADGAALAAEPSPRPGEASAVPAEAPDAPAAEAPDAPAEASVRPHRSRRKLMRFLLAFTFGLLAVLAVSAGALAAYESSTAGRILAGVHVGSVDLSGLAPSEAAVRLRAAYGALGEGQLVLSADGKERTVTYADVGRRIDVDAVVADAMTVGRAGPAIERLASNVRILVRGVDVAPQATLERAALRYEISALAGSVDAQPVDASVAAGKSGFDLAPGANGRSADVDAALRAAETLLADPGAPSTVRVEMPVVIIEPAVTTDEARAARDAADRIAVDVTLVNGSESWTIEGSAIRGWITFAEAADGGYRPVVAKDGLEAGLAGIAGEVAVAPVNATFLMSSDSKVVGVTGAKEGRALDVPNTVATLVKLVDQRVLGLSVSRAPISLSTVEPDLTTADATKTAPLMQPISEWTTYFPIGIKNGQGANIWIPARDINGQVVLPGAWFDFWKAIGPVTRAHGYTDGGAIIDGHTEPQGALAGGICSCSTTLFNAAIRAGLEMGARRNHFYYIDRYPLGLDATVFQSSSGSVQTMSFRNDTASPILILGTGWKVGTKGYVKFVLWSVPTGRDVSFTKPIVKNIKPASDTTVYTTALAPGVRNRVEFPVDGKDVWVTRTVKDATGAIIHQETYYSHYSRVTGVLEIGVAPAPAPTP
jgi:vancomycin resistance protein YoaR